MKYPVSDTQLQLIVGSMLGDGYFVRSQRTRGNPTLRWRHGIAQESYLAWKYSMLGDLAGSGIKYQTTTCYGKKHECCYAVSKTSEKFNPFVELGGKPTKVSRKLLNLLSPLGLAIWYMDDGCLDRSYYTNKHGVRKIARLRALLCTHGYSLEEHYIMQRYFKVVWGLDVAIHRDGNKYRLTFNRTNAMKLFEIIEEHIHPSMLYKIQAKELGQNALPPQNIEE